MSDVNPGDLSPDGHWQWNGQQWVPAPQVGGQQPQFQPGPQAPQQGSFQQPPKKKGMNGCLLAALIVGGIVLLLIVAGVAISAGGGSNSTGGGGTNSQSATPKPTNSVDKCLGSQDASGDVTVGKPQTNALNMSEVKVTVKNNSEKRSNYLIELAAETPDGSQQLGTAATAISNVEPGQTASETALFSEVLPANAKISLK